jgi:ABC-type glycerol-3-phosphate transport system permease component
MELQRALLIYVGGVFLLALLSLLVVFNFIRYRFKGDKTFLFIALFAVAFVATTAVTILLTRTQASPVPLPETFFP